MKLAIIGNGFDIHHNFKTSFNDFREFLISNERHHLVNKIDNFIKNSLGRKNSSSKNTNGLLWNEFEELLAFYHTEEHLISIHNIDLVPEPMKIIELLDDFTEEFTNYIKKAISFQSRIFNQNIAREITNADLIITFNYSDTINLYELKPSTKVFHINGSLEDSNLPIIGYHVYPRHNIPNNDYLKRFNNVYYSKSALAYKRNTINYIDRYQNNLKPFYGEINEIVSIGFSFGNSDSHIKDILKSLVVPQERSARMPLENYNKLKKITFKIFNYNNNETENIISKLSSLFPQTTTTITGIGFKKEEKDLITFKKIDY